MRAQRYGVMSVLLRDDAWLKAAQGPTLTVRCVCTCLVFGAFSAENPNLVHCLHVASGRTVSDLQLLQHRQIVNGSDRRPELVDLRLWLSDI